MKISWKRVVIAFLPTFSLKKNTNFLAFNLTSFTEFLKEILTNPRFSTDSLECNSLNNPHAKTKTLSCPHSKTHSMNQDRNTLRKMGYLLLNHHSADYHSRLCKKCPPFLHFHYHNSTARAPHLLLLINATEQQQYFCQSISVIRCVRQV